MFITLERDMTFEEYYTNITGADVSYVLTRAPTHKWMLSRCSVTDLTVQMGFDGGGSLVEGTMSSSLAGVIFPLPVSGDAIQLDGRPLDYGNYAILPPGSHWFFSCDGAREWICVVIPAELVFDEQALNTRSNRRRVSSIVRPAPGQLEALGSLAGDAHRILSADEGKLDRLRSQMLEICRDMVRRGGGIRVEQGLARKADPVAHIREALEILRTKPNFNGKIDELCSSLFISESTLRRSFHRVLGMGPKRFLRLRRVSQFRRVLFDRQGAASIQHLLAELGITEVGRFAGEYRAIFGETPSQTALRLKAAKR